MQYAVTVDGGLGTINVIVWQLATGGDASMIYAGTAAASLGAPSAATVLTTPTAASVLTGQAKQFNATVQDQYGSLLGSAVSWSVSPSTLGTIDSSGLFTAGSTGGAGSGIATAGSLTATAAVMVQGPTTVALGGIVFRTSATTTTDVLVESSISPADEDLPG